MQMNHHIVVKTALVFLLNKMTFKIKLWQNKSWLASGALLLLQMAAVLQPASAANVMNYGADGNDYFQFTTPSMAFDKASGFTTLITFAMHVNPDGTLLIGGDVACTNGIYTGPTNWESLVATLKTPPTTVTRYEVCIGGYTDTSYNDIESLVASQGTGAGSILYKNFQALKQAVPGIDAINDDDEETYDLNSSISFANMLGGLGYKFTMVPYQNQSFWVDLKNNVTNCDYIYLQCYEGGAGNDPGQWNSAFGNGVVVIPGQESNTSTPATFHSWYLETGVQGGFYYPDIVFDTTYWSAAIIEGNGAVPAAPTGVTAVQGYKQVNLSWNTVPGAISYNMKRSTSSGGETTIASVSTANNNWPISNQYTDNGLSVGTVYYYKISAVNTNGESINSVEVDAIPQAASTWIGEGVNNDWSTSGNWNTLPAFPTSLTFAGSTRLTNTNDNSGITVDGITFAAAAGDFVIEGNAIMLNGNIGFNGNPVAPITQTINFNMAWSASQAIATPANGNLIFGGDITSSTDTSLVKTDVGTLTLGGINTITSWDLNGGTTIISGDTTINGDGNGRIYVGDGDAIADCDGTLVIQNGGVLTINGSFGDTFVIGRDSGSGTVIQNGGIFNFNMANGLMLICATSEAGTTAAYDMNGGVLNMGGQSLSVGFAVNGATTTGYLNQVGGVITNLYNLELPALFGGNGLGIYTLSGGSIYIGGNGITSTGGSDNYTINLGGGTVGAYASWSSSLNMNLTNLNGSVTFDTAGNTITLSGALSGNGGLAKIGSGTLNLSGADTYTGDTTINAGSLELDATGSSPNAFHLANGAKLDLNFSGTYVIAGCYTNGVPLSAGTYNAVNFPGFISGSGSLQVVGAISTGIWTGGGANVNWSTAGNWNNNAVPVFPIGLTFAGTAGLINHNDLTGITADSILFDSAAGAFVLNGNGLSLTGNIGFNENPVAPVTQTVNFGMAWNASETIDTPANGNLTFGGDITSSTDTSLIKTDVGTLTLGGTNVITSWDLNGGTTIITGDTSINGDGSGRIYVGDGDAIANCSGTLVIQNGAILTINGSFGDTFVIGRDSGSGTVIQNGGTFTFNMANGLMLICATSEAGTTAAYDMNGGLLNMDGNTLGIGFAVASAVTTGVVSQIGGVITNLNNLELGPQQSGGLGIYALSGGGIYIGSGGITTAGGNYAINLGGGTVGAYQSWSSPLSMNLTGTNGPVTFDTEANTITLSGLLYGNGGLTKVGSGTLILSGQASYLGNTIVKAGSLELNLAGSNPGAFYLTNGASLNLTSGGTYAVGALYTNNVALPDGVYTSSNLPGFITGTNALQVVSIAISYRLNGGNLTLNWPTNYLGWILQEQTNSLDMGLNANWVDLAGSANVTSTNILISPANPTVFFRLSPPPPLSAPSLTRQMFITNNLLNLPVSNNGPSRRVTITVGGIPVRDFDINLADGAPDWWAFVDVSAFQGQTATITVNNLAIGSTGLSSIVQSNGIVGATNLYSESLRPQVHYSGKRGLINDVNGMIYYNGQYNLYYQHNPYNLNFSANGAERNWGHAVSTDMVHWQELPEAIYPHSYGDWVWSGSAVIDSANTGGFKTGTNDVIVASFYSTARGQCIAYSNDGGLTFTDYTNNPVVTVPGRDPHMLWYAPSNYWVMAVYDSNLGGIDFFTTPDFHAWTYRSDIAGFTECPDMFELPVDGNTNNMLWEINGGNAGYMLGNFNGAVFTPTTAMLPGNLGTGFYASQTFTVMPAGDTRRVRMGWAQVNMPGMPFTGMHFFPTVLTLRTLSTGVQLCSEPIAEITNAVENTYSWPGLNVNPGYNPLAGITGQLFDIQANFTPGAASTISFNLCGVLITYSPASQQITCNGDTQSLPPLNGIVQLEIITDRQSVEIFGNSGQLYMPIVTTPYSSTNNVLSLTSQGTTTVFNSLTVNKLKSIWPVLGD
jgi:autotransporter-associated beta strand protein